MILLFLCDTGTHKPLIFFVLACFFDYIYSIKKINEMTKKDIIEQLYCNGHLRLECEKMAIEEKHLLDDFVQEITLILLEYDDAKIIDLYERDELKFFIYSIIRNQWCNKYNKFFKDCREFNKITISLTDIINDGK